MASNSKAIKKRSNAGRPTKIDKETIGKLEYAFSIGSTDKEACVYAGINPSTLYLYQEKHKEFIERKETLKGMISYKARHVLAKDLESKQDWIRNNTARYIIDKVDGKASQRIDVNANIGISVIRKAYDDDIIEVHQTSSGQLGE